MTKLASNPFFVYIISFTIVFSVYSLGWSDLYPELSSSLIGFFIATFIIALFLGIVVQALKRIEYQKITWNERTQLYLLLVWLGYIFEFIYNKGIPFQMLLQGVPYDYRVFGVPTFHVF